MRVVWQQVEMSRSQLQANSELALNAPEGAPVPSGVWLPPILRDKPLRVSQDVAVTRAPPSIKENVVRINGEADPIGLLIAIANGQPISTFTVTEDGEILMSHETLPLKDRLKVIFHLADKVLPRMQVTKKMGATPKDDSWEATFTTAGSRT